MRKKPSDPAFKLTFWGTRGSIPTPGRSTTRYGGNTSCLEVRAGDTLIILDAGSGIRELGLSLMKEFGPNAMHGHLLITHTHWDHIQGLPFFVPGYLPRNRFKIYGGSGMDNNFRAIIQGQMDPNYFPVPMEEMAARLDFMEIDGPEFNIDDVHIRTTFTNHPGLCLAFRLERKGKTIVYYTDNEPYRKQMMSKKGTNGQTHQDPLEFAESLDLEAVKFATGTDLFIYDAQYTEEEYKTKVGWGHSTVDDAVALALGSRVKSLALFHHDPMHDDAFVDQMVGHGRRLAKLQSTKLKVFGARETSTIWI